MKNHVFGILLGAFIGFLFTILTQSILEWRKRRKIKKTIRLYLHKTITPTIDKIIEELNTVSKAIGKHNSEVVVTGMHPTFNATVLKSFAVTDLQAIYGDKFINVIDIIGILENLQDRLPYKYFDRYVRKAEEHVDTHLESHKDLYPTRDEHFLRCPSIINLQLHTKRNLYHVEKILNHLKAGIEELNK